MALSPVGTEITQELAFNSGVLTVNGSQLIDIQDISLDQKFAEKNFRALNSIFKRAIRRSTYDCAIKFTAVTDSTVLQGIFYSSSSPDGSDVVYSVRDGQQNPAPSQFMITVYTDEAKTKGYQFTLDTPVVLEMNKKLGTEEFAMTEVVVACIKLDNVRRVA